MGKNIRCILILLFTFSVLQSSAQTFAGHDAPDEVKKGKSDRLEIKSALDLFDIKKYPDEYAHVTSVSVNGDVNVNEVLKVLFSFNELYELKLRKYKGSIRLLKKDSLDLIEDVVFYMGYENTNDLKTIDNFPKIRTLTLIHPGPVVEDFSVLEDVKNVKRLNILGDFYPQDIDSMSGYLAKMDHLVHLGLGLDYITDLKRYVRFLPNLKSLSVFDNVSHLRNIEYIDYPMDKRLIRFNDEGKKREILFRFYSDRFNIEPYDLHYLKTIFPDALFDVGNVEDKSDAVNISMTNWSRLSRDTGEKLDYTAFAHPATNIPISYLSPYVEYFRINTTENAIVHTENGTELYIPRLSIVDSKGKTLKGEVVIAFADLDDPVNAFLAGLLSTCDCLQYQ